MLKLLQYSVFFAILLNAECYENLPDNQSLYYPMPFDEELCSSEKCIIYKNWTSEEKCEYIKCNPDSCEGGGYLLWSQYVKCVQSTELKVALIIVAIFYLFFLFIIMTVVADDFFSPAISGIVNHLRMSESIAGVTFLAFGNGAPDVFGSISSVLTTPHPKADLALGDLLGGSIFVTTVVLSAIIFTKSFKVAIIPTLRDLLFFMISLAFICFCFWRYEKVEIWMPATFLGIYACYVVTVILFTVMKKKWKQLNNQKVDSFDSLEISRPSSMASNMPIINAMKDGSSISKYSLVRSLVAYLKLVQWINRMKDKSSTKSKHRDFISNCKLNFHSSKDPKLNQNETIGTELEAVEDDEGIDAEFVIAHKKVYTSYEQTRNGLENIEKINITNWRSWSWLQDLLNHLKPWPSRTEFQKSSWFVKAVVILKVIPVFLFKLTIPSREMSWCKPLFILHCFASVQFALFAVQVLNIKPFADGPALYIYGFALSTFLSIIGLVLLPLKKEQKYYREVYSYIGFLMSISWIYATSNEIVSVITMIGIVTGASQELLGLTIMAWSNCIGDIVADIAVVKQGYPKMAMAAAIGGPLFNLLVGFGLPFTIAAGKGKDIQLLINPVYRILMLFLALSLVTTTIALFIQRFKVRWPHGVCLIFIFLTFLIFITLDEFNILEWN